jgi:hypothetical protein
LSVSPFYWNFTVIYLFAADMNPSENRGTQTYGKKYRYFGTVGVSLRRFRGMFLGHLGGYDFDLQGLRRCGHMTAWQSLLALKQPEKKNGKGTVLD